MIYKDRQIDKSFIKEQIMSKYKYPSIFLRQM